ncbi:MAG TPA: type II toxin-antitoxin system HicA family toxin [Mesorhizobium sp.]|jgi:hypothetical protein
MRGEHQEILRAVFADPVSGSIKWREIESMLAGLGATISEGRGSRVLVEFEDTHAVFHRPHPSPDTDKGAVKALRRFLTNAGVKP